VITPLGLQHENIYGHGKRLRWILAQIRRDDVIVEVGCGTGYMISRPLAMAGHTVLGVDIDQASIDLGRSILRDEGLDPACLSARTLAQLDTRADVVIVSEVLEHLVEGELEELLTAAHHTLQPEGRLLVTVPNGWGWFEAESLLWERWRVGALLRALRVLDAIDLMKSRLLGPDWVERYPSSLSTSPHVQRFTLASIQRLLENSGFRVTSATGTVLAAGPFVNYAAGGIGPLMRLNNHLGDAFPRLAAGFLVSCRKR
jgi:SAM-dependent methyltransferase